MSDLIIRNHLIDAPIEEILELAKSQLTNGKLERIEPNNDWVKVTCPNPEHKGGHESRPSCGVYCGDSPDREYGTMHCFTCGENGSLAHFIGLCFDEDDEFGEDWLVDNFGYLTDTSSIVMSDIELPSEKKKVEAMDESFLDGLLDWHPYLEKRHLTKEVCGKFKVKYDPNEECVVFPVWDEDGNLYTVTKRSVNSKRFVLESDKEKPLYLFNFIKKFDIPEVTIVESQINCLTLWKYGMPSIALFGTGTRHQYDILNRSSIRHYYLAFDGDEAGDKGIRRFLKAIRKDVFVDIIMIPRGKDVNDLTEEEYDSLEIIGSDEWLARYGGSK